MAPQCREVLSDQTRIPVPCRLFNTSGRTAASSRPELSCIQEASKLFFILRGSSATRSWEHRLLKGTGKRRGPTAFAIEITVSSKVGS